MCFQIVDDVLDLTASDETLGKPAGQDLLEGVYTLPVIYTLAESDDAARACSVDRSTPTACPRCANSPRRTDRSTRRSPSRAITR